MANIIKAYAPITSGFQSMQKLETPMLINEYIHKVGVGFYTPYICVLNGKPISRQHWNSIILKKDDTVLFLAFPHGGGEGGSNPMQAIGLIVVMAAAIYAPYAAGPLYAGLAAGTAGGALLSGAIMFGGSYLVNMAFPPQTPNEVADSSRAGTSSSSYNLNDRGNTSALNNPITVQYGRMKHYPKYAMQSWSEYSGNEQYAYLLFCQGQGEYLFEEFNFGTVSSEELSDSTITIFEKNQYMAFPSDGTEWITQTSDTYADDFHGIHNYKSLYIAVGETGEIQVSSDNGTTWATQVQAGSYVGTFYGCHVLESIAVAVGSAGEIQTSDDNGITWTARTADGAFADIFFAVGYGNGVFIAVGSSGEIQTSPDGTTWTARTADGSYVGSFSGIDYGDDGSGNGRWVAVGTSGEIQTSDNDGATWTARTADGSYVGSFYDVAYGDGKWVAVGETGLDSLGEIQTSTTGAGWTEQSISGTAKSFYGITYNEKVFIAVGEIYIGSPSLVAAYTSTSENIDMWVSQETDSSYLGYFVSVSGNVAVGSAGQIQKAFGDARAYNNVFTSDQVQNVEVKRISDYVVTAVYTGIYGAPLDAEKLMRIEASPGTIPFTNGVFGNVDHFDGFIAGDTIEFNQPWFLQITGGSSDILYYPYNKKFKIKSSYYETIDTIDVVAYEFDEDLAELEELNTQPDSVFNFGQGTTMTFIPTALANGYVVPHINSVIQKASVDIAFPNGLYNVNTTTGAIDGTSVDFSIEYKEIDANGVEDVAWSNTGVITESGSLRFPVYKTYDIPITDPLTKKIRVRINRDYGTATEYAASNRAVNHMTFSSLKVFLEDTERFGEVTMVHVKVKTSNSLIQATLSQFNTVSTRKLPIYTTSWSEPTATRSPAWAIADACRNSEYSLGIPDANIDIDELVTLDATWASRNDYCDGLFENKEVFWDALRKICKVGRAQPLMIAGSVGFVRDQPRTVPVQVFSSDNIQFGSFNVDYIPFDDDTPNAVEMEYFDETDWIWKKTLQTIPGGDTTKPASLQKWGIVTEEHAIREAKYESACNAYRRKLPSFTTELEGRILKRLDYISISSPRVGWGTSGHIVNVSGNELELSEPVAFTTGDHYIAFRNKNGSQDGPYIVTEVTGESKKVLMAETPPVHIYTGYEYEKTMFQFGQGDSYDRKALVATVQPQGLQSVALTCIIDDERVYYADGTSPPINGYLTALQNLEHDTVHGIYHSVVEIDDTHFLMTYSSASYEDYLKVFEIDSTGLPVEIGTPYLYGTEGYDCSLIKYDATHYAMAYGTGATALRIRIFEVDGAYAITPTSTFLTGYSAAAASSKIFSLALIDPGYLALAFLDSASEAWVATFAVDGAYAVTNIDAIEHDTALCGNNSIAVINSTHFAVAYYGADTDGYLKIFSTDSNYNNIAVASTLEHDTVNGRFNSLVLADSTHLALAYAGGASLQGILKVFELDGAYAITELAGALNHTTPLANSGYENNLIKVSSGIYSLCYNGASSLTGSEGHAKTFSLNSSYVFEEIDFVAFSPSTSITYTSSVLVGDTLVFAYTGADSDGFIQTFEIT